MKEKKLLGKFNNIAELEKAYCLLESAYTKKCQDLKQLEKEIDISVNGALPPEKALEVQNIAAEISSDDTAAGLIIQEQAADTAIQEQPVESAETAVIHQDGGVYTDGSIETGAVYGIIEATANDGSTGVENQMQKNVSNDADLLKAGEQSSINEYGRGVELPHGLIGVEQKSDAAAAEECSRELKEKIISEYLLELANAKVPYLLNGGQGKITLLPPKRPKNLAEAGILAAAFLKK